MTSHRLSVPSRDVPYWRCEAGLAPEAMPPGSPKKVPPEGQVAPTGNDPIMMDG